MTNFPRRLLNGHILVMGRAGLDLYPDPPGTKTKDASSFVAGLGGPGGNISAAIARAGAKVALLTCVSDDPIGDFTLARLAHHGIDSHHVRAIRGEARNTLAIAESVLAGHQTVIYRNGAADFQIATPDIDAVDFSRFAAVITAGTVFAMEPSRSAAFLAFERARAAGCMTIFDIDYRPYSWPSAQVASDVLSQAGALADMVVGNDEEFGFMAGDYANGMAHARKLAAQGTPVIYKMGEKGAITLANGVETHVPVFAVDALKPIGAGDAFLGTLVASLTKGADLAAAVRRGAAAAALVVSRVGCALNTPSPEEIDLFMQERA